MKHRVIISLGSNLGNRELYIKRALKELEEKAGQIGKVSAIIETPAWGYVDNTSYLNCVVECFSELSPEKFLTVSQNIEKSLGRLSKTRKTDSGEAIYEARTIDIDILFYDSEIVKKANLTIPHPLLHERLFVLKPLNEIFPDFTHPILNQSINTILSQSNSPSKSG